MLSADVVVFKLLLGTLLGGIIGFERQTHGRPAGFRTQLLVCGRYRKLAFQEFPKSLGRATPKP